MTRQRALSLRAASECENARHPQCKCRCGGALHGAARMRDVRQLPLDDPHSPSTKCPKCDGTGKRKGWAYDAAQGYDIPTEYPCRNCAGAGRIITRAVERAVLDPVLDQRTP